MGTMEEEEEEEGGDEGEMGGKVKPYFCDSHF